MIPTRVISGISLGISRLSEPQDVFVTDDGTTFIADTGNNRIVVIDKDYRLVKVISGFNNGESGWDTFNKPTGLFVTKDGLLYIADSQNGRIVVLDDEGLLVRIYGIPQSPLIGENFEYIPLKIAVDSAKRLNVVAKDMEKGIIQLNQEGRFIRFFGAIPTPPNLLNSIVRAIGTEEMKKSLVANIPTVYSNVAIDSKDFIYGTVGSVDSQKYDVSRMLVRKLNPAGSNILKHYGNVPVYGTGQYVDTSEWPWISVAPFMCDIAVNNKGMYAVLDQRTAHVFTYDDNGILLFTFGSKASVNDPKMGQFGLPVALDYKGDNEMVVLDSMYNQMVVFELTEYGNVISKITEMNHNHNYTSIENYIETALKYTSKSELIYNNIGKYYFNQGNYSEALKYFKLGENRTEYSNSFKYVRRIFMSEYFGILMPVFIVVVIALIIRRIRKKRISKTVERMD